MRNPEEETNVKRLCDWACGCAEMLASAALALIVVLNLCFGTVLSSSESAMTIVRNGLPFLLSLALWAALLIALCGGRGHAALNRVRPEATFALCAAAYVLLTAYLMGNVYQWRLVGDMEAVYYAANDLHRQEYGWLRDGRYLSRYPYQIGLVAVMSAMMGICADPMALRCVNLLILLLIHASILRAAMQLPGASRATGNLAVLLSFLVIPQMLHIVFIYGNIPSLCLLLFAVLALCAWMRGGRAAFAVLAVVLMSLAYLIRTNMMIACIALACVCVLAFLGRGKKRCLSMAVCLLLGPLLLTQAVQAYYSRAADVTFDQAEPSLAWVAMGMQEDGAMPGWYNNYTDRVYYENGYDPQAVERQVRTDIRERLYDFKMEPAMALRFYVRKLITTWCEPTFGCIAIAGFQAQEDCHTPLLRSLYSGGTAFTVLREAMHGLMTLVYALSALYPWLRRKTGAPRSAYALFAQIFFLGGFLFHILWETKSMYVLCYAVCLLPLAARSAQMLFALRAARWEKKAATAA